MKKQIDADKLIERLEEIKKAEYENCGGVNAKTGVLQEVQELISTLQQEQPEVELEDDFLLDEVLKVFDSFKRLPPRDKETMDFLENLARHFWNKGYNARKEDRI